MAVYTTKAKVRDLDKLITSALLADAKLDDIITDATNEIDFRLGNRYVTPFNDIGAATPTPKMVELACRYRTAAMALERYYSDRSAPIEETEEPVWKAYERRAEKYLQMMESGEYILTDAGVTKQTDKAKTEAGLIYSTNPENTDNDSGFNDFRQELAAESWP